MRKFVKSIVNLYVIQRIIVSANTVSIWHYSCYVFSVMFKFLHRNHDVTKFWIRTKRTDSSHRYPTDTNQGPDKLITLYMT